MDGKQGTGVSISTIMETKKDMITDRNENTKQLLKVSIESNRINLSRTC